MLFVCVLGYNIHIILSVFGGQSVGSHVCIGALVFCVCVWDTLYI